MRHFALMVATLLLAGCQTVNSTWSSISSSDPKSQSSERPGAPIGPQTAMLPPQTAGMPGSLNGQTGEALHALWGEPSLKRKDLGSELWQYAGKGCTLLIYLYPSSGGAMTVSHAEAVPGGTGEAAIDECAKAAGKPPIKPLS
jgi:hypothetical protein